MRRAAAARSAARPPALTCRYCSAPRLRAGMLSSVSHTHSTFWGYCCWSQEALVSCRSNCKHPRARPPSETGGSVSCFLSLHIMLNSTTRRREHMHITTCVPSPKQMHTCAVADRAAVVIGAWRRLRARKAAHARGRSPLIAAHGSVSGRHHAAGPAAWPSPAGCNFQVLKMMRAACCPAAVRKSCSRPVHGPAEGWQLWLRGRELWGGSEKSEVDAAVGSAKSSARFRSHNSSGAAKASKRGDRGA